MNRFRPELFDKDERTYVYKRADGTPYGELTLKGHMLSDENIDLITRMMILEVDMDGNLNYKQVREKVKGFMDSWNNLGKFDDERVLGEVIQHNINVAVDHINHMFIDTFKENFYQIDNYYEEDVNPFRVPKEGKLHKDMYVDDIRALNVQSLQKTTNIYNQFLVRDNKIPHWQILNARHYDRKNNEGLNSSGFDRENLVFKSYGQKSMELLTQYENHNDVHKHLPFSDPRLGWE